MIKWEGKQEEGRTKRPPVKTQDRKWNRVKDKGSQMSGWRTQTEKVDGKDRGECVCVFSWDGESGEEILTVGVVEDNDAALLGLSLLWVHHGGADDKIHWRVFSQATWHHAEGILAGEELMGMEDW